MQPNGPVDGLDRMVAGALAAGVPGAHLSVSGDGLRVDSCAGAAQVFADDGPALRPLTVDAAHDLGSVTKVTGTTAMLMALTAAGELSVDDKVVRYLPQTRSAQIADATLRDLLLHRAGLWEWWPTYLVAGDPLDTVLRLPLRYPPGAGRHYSDLGFMILGRVVESVTGQEPPDALAALVNGPLGISALRYAAPMPGVPVAASSRGDRIERHMVASGEPYPVTADGAGFDWRTRVLCGEVNDGNAFHSFGGAAGHAGLFGTASALHQLGAELIDAAGGTGPWSSAAHFFRQGPDAGQLLGFRSWRSDWQGCSAELIGHTGFPGIGFGFLPQHRASVVLATNRLHVENEPATFAPLWTDAIAAAHEFLHRNEQER